MKLSAFLFIFMSCFFSVQSFAQTDNTFTENFIRLKGMHKEKPQPVKENTTQPKTRKQAISGVKVFYRHHAKFYYNKQKISFRTAKRLVRKKFNTLIITENRDKNTIHFMDK